MATSFPQELLDAIVDEVAEVDYDSLFSLLKSSRCFGQQCRLNLYHTVTMSVHYAPSVFHDLIMSCPNLGDFVNTFDIVFDKDAGPPFWIMVFEVMARLPRLKAVIFTEAITFRGSGPATPPSKMLLEDLPSMSTVRSVKIQYVKRLFVEDVARILSAFQGVSVLELSKCNTVGDRDSSSVAPPVPVVLETLSVLHAESFVTEILAASAVAPPMISLHKLKRLVIAGAITQRLRPSYEDLFRQVKGTVEEVIMYTNAKGVLEKSTLFVEVPSLIIVPHSVSDFDFLSQMLQVSYVERPVSRGLKKLALVFRWSTAQHPLWSRLADLLAELTLPPFSLCITLAWPSYSRPSDHKTLEYIKLEVLASFKGTKQRVRVQVLDMDLADWTFHMESTEFLYF